MDLNATVSSPRNQALSWKEVCAQHMFSDFRQVGKKKSLGSSSLNCLSSKV